jgi:hypothetical protein
VLLAAGVAASSGGSARLEIFGLGFDTRASVVFFIGVCTAAALLAGAWLVKKGVGRGYRRRKEVRDLRQKVEAAPKVEAEPRVEAAPSRAAELGDGNEPEDRAGSRKHEEVADDH